MWFIPLIMMAGAAMSAYGQYQAGQARKRQGEINALLAERAASTALQAGAVGAGRAETRGSEMIGRARVAAAASNVDVQSGAVLDVVGKTRMMSTLDDEMIKTNARYQAYNDRIQAASYRVAGDNEAAAGEIGAFTTLIGGAANAYAGYRMANPPGGSTPYGPPPTSQGWYNDSAPAGVPMSLNYNPNDLPTFGRG